MLRYAVVCIGFGSVVALAVALLDGVARWCVGI